ncbi:SatD family protein [Nesterenkonia muleiensis]|uniref:SatD family protein n=1 Tax=Nesterenkonia muleiensis TaxID=2282648 RepID=UPI000E723178|nr:SatD family protein [Nesterenkonia muleiensis]
MDQDAPVALIADVIGSRQQADRAELQRGVEAALDRIAEAVPPTAPFRATVGDEFQAVYATRNEALRATLFAGLLPQHGDLLRFGLGEGEVGPVPSATSPDIQDGPGWWHAREAIEKVEDQQSRFPFLRSWYVSAAPRQDTPVNAYLLTRDQLMAGLSVRARDYARGVAQGDSQKTVAAEYGVSQPAVSKLLRDSGAHAVVEGFRMFS